MYGQPAMMNMAGVIPQQPMANFGYGNNNVGFQGANMGNNMGYDQWYGNMNNFWQLAGRVLSRAQQNIRKYFTNYSKCLTSTTVPATAKVYTRGNSQKIGNPLRRAREFVPWNHSNKSGEIHKKRVPERNQESLYRQKLWKLYKFRSERTTKRVG